MKYSVLFIFASLLAVLPSLATDYYVSPSAAKTGIQQITVTAQEHPSYL